MGSLMVRAMCPKSPEYRDAFASRRLLVSQMKRMTPRAPRMRPGKKPAAKDLPSKLEFAWGKGSAGQPEVCDAEAEFVGEDVGTGIAEEGVCLEAMHMPLLQV